MRAIITGASSGIGRATARLLSGPDVRITAVGRDPEKLQSLANELQAQGGEVLAISGDVRSADFCGEIVERTVAAFGGVDTLVSNAGVMNNAALADLDTQAWDWVFEVNVRATWLLAKAAYPHLRSSRGSIVATGSISAYHPIPQQGAYSSSKAALLMLIRQLANEWGPDGIRVNSVSPGMVVTDMSAQFYADDSRRRRRSEQIPLRAVADPEHIASFIAFLVGPDASYMTGQDILVDGGIDTSLMPAIRRLTDS